MHNGSSAFPSEVQDVPTRLQATITSTEPYRSQALADARLFLILPKPIGFGLTPVLRGAPTIVPFDCWREKISLLRLKLRWSERMDDDFSDSADETLHRVGREDGRWIIVQLWDEALRQRSREWMTLAQRDGGAPG